MKANNFKLIDKGNNSQIFLYEEKVVLKMVDVKFGKQVNHLRNEFELMKTLSHPHILKVLGLKHNIPIKGISDPNSDCRRDVLLMEYANAGSLLSVLKTGVELQQKKAFATQLLDALKYLHLTQKVAHRDIKLDNVLVRKDVNGSLTALISDFGFAIQDVQKNIQTGDIKNQPSSGFFSDDRNEEKSQKLLENGNKSSSNLINPKQKKPFLANSYKGTKRGYMAPQIHKLLQKSQSYDPFKVDVFSFGVVLFCLFFQRLPFELASAKDTMYKLVVEHRFTQFWAKHKVDEVNYPNLNLTGLKDVLQKMMQQDPKARFSMCEVSGCQFFESLRIQSKLCKKVESNYFCADNEKSCLVASEAIQSTQLTSPTS